MYKNISSTIMWQSIAGYHMDELSIKCVLFVYPNKAVEVGKEGMVKVDEDNYIILLTTELVKKVGRGQYPGKQSSAGNGGGGWYGGGGNKSDMYIDYVKFGSGGSGFVNTAANASYRPSGYTGLQLDSGNTTAGNSSHPSIDEGTEIGHSGNGYARITVL